ncbi:thiamine phosphate synthase [Arthrobacter woluwensis]|jgi:thiamine-phosphate pyrophosphorylase|uniref:thiamine phosphate synthase n=1 Tax=Arthrobacter woluwensis TaxID=156980 RepID=UPI000D12BE92|nr:thiamine phosphate synthase [Arthrobacter woluwensis]PSS43849.1 thiamine phosphate synthase [Arthrobacter woluwensis]QTF72119.1 thiamine phosphate synthase [Arthrobacter woluwensis]
MGNRAIATPSLAAARLYVCTDSRAERGDFADFVDAAYSGGVDIIQLRDKTIEAAEELELLTVLRDAAERHGKLWAVNDRADIARLSGSPVLHLGQKDLPLPAARSLLNDDVVLGLSSHAPEQVDAALAAAARGETDYFCVGPLWATPTKPGRAGVGLDLVRYADSTGTSVPWFAIGGIDHGNVAQVVEAGARRVVVVRAVTEASDPADAARRLLAELPDA